MQNAPVCRLRNQFLPLGYEAFCHLSSYFMFPKRIHSLPHSSFLRENQIQVKTRTLIALSSIMQAQIYLFDSSTEGKANEMLEFILSSYILCVWAAVWTWLSQLFIISLPACQKHVEAVLIAGRNCTWQERKKLTVKGVFLFPAKLKFSLTVKHIQHALQTSSYIAFTGSVRD